MITRRFELDVDNERATARLRLVAALFVFVGAGLVVVTMTHWFRWVLLVLALAATVGWTVSVARSRRKIREPEGSRLAFDEAGIHLPKASEPIPWSTIKSIHVDEEHLTVLIELRYGDPVKVEPQYRGLSVYDLADALREGLLVHSEAHSEALTIDNTPPAPHELRQ